MNDAKMNDTERILLLLLFYIFNNENKMKEMVNSDCEQEGQLSPLNLTENIIKSFVNYDPEREKVLKEIRDNCPLVKWEHDMGASIPFCKKTGDFCNMQCVR